jgi:hypothetical protein
MSNVSKWTQKLYLGQEECRSPAHLYEQCKVQVKSDSAAQTVNFGSTCDSNFLHKTFCCVLRKLLIFTRKSYKLQSVQALKPKDKR